MHPAVSLIAENALQNQHLLLPVLLLVLATVATVHTPIQHSLLITAVSWALIWIPTIFRAGLWSSNGSNTRKTASWVAGGFLALAQICDRAARDKEGIWSTKALLPLLVVVIPENELWFKYGALPTYILFDDTPSDGSNNSEKRSPQRSFRLLTIVTISAATVLATSFSIPSTSVLGLSSVIFTAAGLVLFEGALKAPKVDSHTGRRGFVSANGTFSRRDSVEGAQKEQHIASLRDVAAVITVVCGLATYLMEPITPDSITWEPRFRELQGDWKMMHYRRTVQRCILMIFVNVLVNTLLFFMLFQQGAVQNSFLLLASYIFARLNLAASFLGIWFTIIFVSATVLFLYNSSSSSSGLDLRSSMRFRRLILGVTTLSFGLLFLRYISGAKHYSFTNGDVSTFDAFSPETPFAPVPIDLKKGHPADQLIKSAEKKFEDLLNRQSNSLAEAVQEYRRRYGIPPPPNFDRWYEFATRNSVQLIDEFDTITRSLLPFWALKPSTVRERVKLALGSEENALMGMMIRDGNVVKVDGGPEWQQQATTGMMKDFVHWLPDMDLAFNIHDEPRVVVPHDQLSFLVGKARDQNIPAAMKNQFPRNSFSPRAADMNNGRRFEEAKTTRFNKFAHQQTWTHSRLSCSTESQARNYEDRAVDNFTSYATGPLNYVYNVTAFSDICNSPSLASTFGFFERPNAFNIIHELTPIFSQSKISSFQDILYPSPWYWFGKVGYDVERDTTWTNKTNSLYWRGSTTGGFSRNGGWRRQHRQHVVRRLNAPDKAKILVNKGDDKSLNYEVREVERKDNKRLVDVHFSHVGQCDPGDCDAQREFFEVTERVDGQDAWGFKHLLDMDGNAFSGRFYAFLKSRSLTYKMAVFREWHQEWMKPWVHYIPISLIGDEHLDLVRWFGGAGQDEQNEKVKEEAVAKGQDDNKGGNGDSMGETKAREIAERSTEWANKVLRNVDFEAWFFRLLLEYGRVIDDNRDTIGYSGP
ncbi:glycosyltransferase family 90 protein [Zopfia rhizophila CBS 207.26]|uniref:Glycosyltransferase family 90 protein n=1 Tax=Zopfia rhizophila CBS 207.26 TaxID=1314779 RepID=A0A6A6DW13_9PEZI|nr:glycosyltransferase family 90 protein [Zopfia rhizophila CBS 207.26]